jgi:D-alanine-D-alanine ligase
MTRFKRVAVIAGGPTSERDISLRSGSAVKDALSESGFDAVLIDVYDEVSESVSKVKPEAVFIALHGGFGEDGTVQSALAELKIPYTGSGPEASRKALDKLESRILFEKHGLKAPKYVVVNKGEEPDIDSLNAPLVVKPKTEGSSVGLSVIRDAEDLRGALDEAFKYGDTALVEEFIKGRELTVGILDDKALPVVEIIPEGGCYDYKAKYESSNTRYLVPAPITDDIASRAGAAGIEAFKALGCRSFSRVDMILGDDNALYLLEVNTIPGLTSRSLLPKAAEAAGIDFRNLCRKILEGARV